jgi:hypothetical protein
MGLIALNYTTSQGFLVPQLYLQITSIRMLKTLQGPTYGMSYAIQAYKSVEDKEAGLSPIPLPNYLAYAEEVLTADDFYTQTIFGFAYTKIKRVWTSHGFVVEDYYPHPPTPTTYIYDCSGYSFRGFNCGGRDREGYDRAGFNSFGIDREGYDREGFNSEGYNREGYDREGYNREGYDKDGYNKEGYDKDGYNKEGIDREGNSKPMSNISSFS